MKTIWQGTISFGLVSIPIKIFPAINHKSANFKLVHKKDNGKIRYKRFCEEDGQEVPWEDISKVLEISKGKYYTLSREELDKIKPEKTQSIEIREFVNLSHIDPIFFDAHYYLSPSKEKNKAFFLLKQVLQQTGKAAVGRFVMREKEYTAVISSYKSGLLLTTLNYQYEIRDINDIEELKQVPAINKEERELAEKLIQQLTREHLDMDKYKDTFGEQLKELIKKKEKGEPIAGKKIAGKKEENLIIALKKSLK
jgi:DNA end-binding protein Ku